MAKLLVGRGVRAVWFAALLLFLPCGVSSAALITYSTSGTVQLKPGFADVWGIGPSPVNYTFSVTLQSNATDDLPALVDRAQFFAAPDITSASFTINGSSGTISPFTTVEFFDWLVAGVDVFFATFSATFNGATQTVPLSYNLPPSFQFTQGSELPPIFASTTIWSSGGTSRLAGSYFFGHTQGTPFVVEFSAVPEPASLTLWSLAALGLAAAGSRRRRIAA